MYRINLTVGNVPVKQYCQALLEVAFEFSPISREASSSEMGFVNNFTNSLHLSTDLIRNN